MIANRLQARRDNLLDAGIAGKTEDGAPCIGVPVRRTQPGKSRYQINTVVDGRPLRQRFCFTSITNKLKAVPQPLNGGAGNKNTTLQGVGGLAVNPVGHRGKQAVLRLQSLIAGIEHQEAASAIGALRHANAETGLAKQGGLLIAGHAQHRGTVECSTLGDLPELIGGVHYLRKQRFGNIKEFQKLRIPFLVVDVEQHRAAGIGGVCAMLSTAGQSPQQKAVDGTERELPALRPLPYSGDIFQNPANLGGRKIGINQQTGLAVDPGFEAFAFQGLAIGGRSPILPDNGVVDGLSGFAIPDHGGLALVGDAYSNHFTTITTLFGHDGVASLLNR